MNTTLIFFGIVILAVIVLILYQVLNWWNNKQLKKYAIKGEVIVKEMKEKMEVQEQYGKRRITNTNDRTNGGTEPVAPVESNVKGSNGNEFDAVGGIGIHKNGSGEYQVGDK